jgi:DNA polymerase-3 subunit gamma/tau
MSYLVLARRWRPKRFEEVIGQRHVTRTLENAIRTGRVAHAYLFAGARGVGKTTVARILAKALNCEAGPTPEPCGQCDSCREISDGVAMDVQEIDGASNTGVDNVRDLRDALRYLPARGRSRIYIIDEVHMLSPNAFNALLKTLEEPPPHVVFIFATTEAHKIPVTILSRCQRFDFRRIPLAEIVAHLEKISQAEGIEVDRDTLVLIAKEAQGSLRDSQSLLDQVISYGGNRISAQAVQDVLGILDRHWLYSTSDSLIRRDPGGCLAIVEGLFEHGYSLTYFYHQLVEHVRNLMVIRLNPEEPEAFLHLPDHEVASLRDQVSEVRVEDLHLWFDILAAAEEDVRRSAYPRYLLEMLLVKMATLDRTQDIEGMLDRVQSAREALAGATGTGLPGAAGPQGQGESSGPVPEAPPLSEKGWSGFLEHVRRHRPALASILEQGRFMACSQDGVLRVAFPAAFHVEKVGEKEQARTLERLGAGFFGRAVRIAPVLDAQTGACRENNARHQLQVDVKAHPLVQEALEVFGGQVVEIRLPGAPGADGAPGEDEEEET